MIGANLQVQLQQESPFQLDVTLNCNPGELLALVGPSGSGKTTVLRTIAGLHRVSIGQIRFGTELWLDTHQRIHRSTQNRKVGLVFQDYALFPHKSVLENVLLATPGQTFSERHNSAMDWLQRTNIKGLHAHKPAALSGGQKQRVALARALARQPTVLLMDEPFSAVDQQTRRKLYRELARLRSDLNIPILLVTHDIHEVQQLADSLCLLHHGTSLTQGPVSEIISKPDCRVVAKLLGHQNLFAARVISTDQYCTRYALSENAELCGPPESHITPGSIAHLLIAPSAITAQDVTRHKAPSAMDANKPQGWTANQLCGTVAEAVGLGDEISVRLHLDSVPKALRFRIASHEAQTLGIELGKALSVCIRPDGLHAMTS
ncbi:MAG: ABC transporter ATP-binding protein [Granulosicoccus sp.]